MRILHFADLHIGVENYGRPASQADLDALPESFSPGVDRRAYLGLSTRLLDFLSAFDEVVTFAIDQKVDLVLFAGDAYKSRDPSQTHQREFARRIARLTSAGIHIFLLVGNHDIPHAPSRATALEIFPTLSIPRVHVADRLGTYTIDTPNGPLQVIAIPWVRRGVVLSQEETRGLSPQDVTKYIQDRLTERLQQEIQAIDPSTPAIIAGHVTVGGATTSSEKSMMLGHDYVLLRSNLTAPNIDYVALGHIHKHQVLGDSPPIVYAGSLQRVDFSEERDQKGFCLVELDPTRPPGERTHWEFINTHARPFVTIEATLQASDPDPTATLIRNIARHHTAGAVVRLNITLPEEIQGRLNENALRDALQDAHFIAPFKKEIIRERRPRLGIPSEGITPYEALERYLQGREQIDDERRKRAIELGKELIQKEMAEE